MSMGSLLPEAVSNQYYYYHYCYRCCYYFVGGRRGYHDLWNIARVKASEQACEGRARKSTWLAHSHLLTLYITMLLTVVIISTIMIAIDIDTNSYTDSYYY